MPIMHIAYGGEQNIHIYVPEESRSEWLLWWWLEEDTRIGGALLPEVDIYCREIFNIPFARFNEFVLRNRGVSDETRRAIRLLAYLLTDLELCRVRERNDPLSHTLITFAICCSEVSEPAALKRCINQALSHLVTLHGTILLGPDDGEYSLSREKFVEILTNAHARVLTTGQTVAMWVTQAAAAPNPTISGVVYDPNSPPSFSPDFVTPLAMNIAEDVAEEDSITTIVRDMHIRYSSTYVKYKNNLVIIREVLRGYRSNMVTINYTPIDSGTTQSATYKEEEWDLSYLPYGWVTDNNSFLAYTTRIATRSYARASNTENSVCSSFIRLDKANKEVRLLGEISFTSEIVKASAKTQYTKLLDGIKNNNLVTIATPNIAIFLHPAREQYCVVYRQWFIGTLSAVGKLRMRNTYSQFSGVLSQEINNVL